MMSRLGPIPTDTMSDAQRRVFDGITGGPRAKGDPAEFLNEEGALRGPFNAMLYSPEMGDLLQQLGGKLRYETVIPAPLRELAIITVGRHFNAEYEWWAHVKVGKKEGLSDDTIERVMNGLVPVDAAEAIVYRFVSDLQTETRVDDSLYAETFELLGEQGLTELVFLAGYYATISHILNAFEVGLPSGVEPAFD
ncbi:carboxymuconolactone decarboxylase family protein [Thalassospiraceae bacterium LMO-JJ14]|nr:carboxymuconolactone decarboxylase family protein [Thalassospiraceae bacterium LMO-JJ14]